MDRSNRILSLDILRFLTVTFALVSHTVLHYDFEDLMSENVYLVVKSVTRTATPALLVLFGIMAEIVYTRKFHRDRRGLSIALINRAIVCYLCFVLLALVALIVGEIGVARFVGALALVKTAPLANIFKMYALLLLLIIFLVALRVRFGMWGIWSFAAAIWLADWAVLRHVEALPGHLDHVGGLLFGIGDVWGPSILHALFLVIAGITFGNALYVRQPSGAGRVALALLIAICLGGLGAFMAEHGLRGVLHRISDYDAWRASNHIGYYLYGVLSLGVIALLAEVLSRVLPRAILQPATQIGAQTLPYFLLGNLVLLAVPAYPATTGWMIAAICVVEILAACILTLAWSRLLAPTSPVVTLNRQLRLFAERFVEIGSRTRLVEWVVIRPLRSAAA
ncbi:hypothetical protein [Pontivivens ytuae]|uniref:Heparan-alpha-glucosaminide N-acetyltransferase catalytic domain-containing protein n=1 Tax=Pontivivens ytuae TaxID=2789856 RepID=A0A7S9LPC7_9RHOB|nr:hypothetical protein [Pontivivens ytuae]QPH52631.1 hypothetical protein I0K15_12500 [Pontivivens ytuae]